MYLSEAGGEESESNTTGIRYRLRTRKNNKEED